MSLSPAVRCRAAKGTPGGRMLQIACCQEQHDSALRSQRTPADRCREQPREAAATRIDATNSHDEARASLSRCATSGLTRIDATYSYEEGRALPPRPVLRTPASLGSGTALTAGSRNPGIARFRNRSLGRFAKPTRSAVPMQESMQGRRQWPATTAGPRRRAAAAMRMGGHGLKDQSASGCWTRRREK